MKRLLIIAFLVITTQTFAQTGWVQQRSKVANKDSTSFSKDANFLLPARFQQSFKIGAVTITANGTELNILDNALVNTAELNYLVGVTSAVQTQLNAKAPTANPTFTGVQKVSTTDTLSTKAYSRTAASEIIADTMTARLNSAGSLSDYAFLKSDANTTGNAVTLEYAQGLLGSGGGSVTHQLKGIVDATYGIPESGDSLIINSQFHLHPRIYLYRNGSLHYQLESNLHNLGYWDSTYVINYDTLIAKPVFKAGEKLLLFAYDEIAINDLVPEGGSGGGGDPGYDSLYTAGQSYGWNWLMDETTGSIVNPTSTGDYSGTAYNSPPIVAGVHGNARSFASASSQYVNFGADAGNMSTDNFSISCWVYIDAHTGSERGVVGKWMDDDNYGFWRLQIATSNFARLYLSFGSSTIDYVYSNTTIPQDQWVNIITTVNRAGLAKLYINGVLQSSTLNISSHSATTLNNPGTLAIGRYGDEYPAYADMVVDEVMLFRGTILSSTQITKLQTKFWPYNE